MTALTALALAAEPPAGSTLVDRIAAIVNDDVITLSEVRLASQPMLQGGQSAAERDKLYQDVLEDLISQRILEQQVEASAIQVTESDVDRAVQDILRQNNITESQLEQALVAQNVSMAQYRENLREQLRQLKVVDQKVRSKDSISDQDIREEYDRVTRSEERKEFVEISHLFFLAGDDPEGARAAAEAARARVDDGENFADVAKEVSKGPTAADGGSLGKLAVDGLLPELAAAVEPLEPGEMSGPVEAGSGYHIVLLQAREFQASQSLEEMTPRLRERLYQQAMERQMQLWLEELKANSAIDRRL